MRTKTSMKAKRSLRRWGVPCAVMLAGVLATIASLAQPVVQWAATSAGAVAGYPSGLFLTPARELYLLGSFDSATFAQPETVIHKFDLQGNRIGSQASRGERIASMASDAQGNIVMVGRVWDAERLGTGVVNDLYLGKYSPAGKLIWERTLGSPRDLGLRSEIVGGNGVAIDRDGNIFVAGNSTGSAVFGNVTFPGTAGGPLLCKFSPAGSLVWARRLEGPADKVLGYGGTATSIAVDAEGHIVFTGYLYNGAIDFWGTTVTISGPYDSNSFIAKVLPNGDVAWVVPNFAFASIAVDRQNNIYFNGRVPQGGMQCGKLNPAGEVLWQRNIQNASGGGVALNGKGEPIFNAELYRSIILDGIVAKGPPPPESDAQEILLCKASVDGKFEWAITTGGRTLNRCAGAVSDGADNIYLAGTVRCIWQTDVGWVCESATLDRFELPTLPEAAYDTFVAKLTDPSSVTVALTAARVDSGLVLSWPAAVTGFVLEFTDILTAPIWSVIDAIPVVEGEQNVITVKASGSVRFYRLRKP